MGWKRDLPSLRMGDRRWLRGAAAVALAASMTGVSGAEEVAVLFPEGSVHGFLQLSEAGGKVIAGGDLMEVAKGDRVTTRLVFRFKDGSVDDERSMYMQRGHLQLLTDRHIQHGPVFKDPVDMALDVASGTVTTRTVEAGHETAQVEHMALPKDLANGMMLMLLKNLPAKAGATTVSYLAATPKPRLVKLVITPMGEAAFVVGGVRHAATHYMVKPELGGLAGVIAPVVGMQPKPTEVWMSGGEVPAFGRLQGPTFLGGPQWTVEVAKPSWPAEMVGGRATPADGTVVR